jgi:hypothetical protein
MWSFFISAAHPRELVHSRTSTVAQRTSGDVACPTCPSHEDVDVNGFVSTTSLRTTAPKDVLPEDNPGRLALRPQERCWTPGMSAHALVSTGPFAS